MPKTSRRAFTLIELLVVIAVIAVLIGILLPSLAGARNSARALKSAANARSVVQGVLQYTITNNVFPSSYLYGAKTTGLDWNLADQQNTNPNPSNGYVHWTAFLFGDGGGVAEEAFKNPAAPRGGGAPASNPGSNPDDWEPGQVNDLGGTAGATEPVDRQVKRLGYMGNAAIFPRNKFSTTGGALQRKNQFVSVANVDMEKGGGAKTILITELLYGANWGTAMEGSAGSLVSKSHRAITPFVSPSTGVDVYNAPPASGAPFRYPDKSLLKPLAEISAYNNLLSNTNNPTETMLNAVGRFHQGGPNKEFGGNTVFGFVDGHVETINILQTIPDASNPDRRLWGERFYSLTGGNQVLRPRTTNP